MPSRTQLAMHIADGNKPLHAIAADLLRAEMGWLNNHDGILVRIGEGSSRDDVLMTLPSGISGLVTRESIQRVLMDDESILITALCQLIPTLPSGDGVGLAELVTGKAELRDTGPAVAMRGAPAQATSRVQALETELENSHAVVVIGPSSSGKSVLCDLVKTRREERGSQTLWFDLSRPGLTWQMLAFALGGLIDDGSSLCPLVVLDDLQGAPSLASELLQLWTHAQPRAKLLMAAWPDAEQLVVSHSAETLTFAIDGSVTARLLTQAAGATWDAAEEILALASGDALVADLATHLYSSRGEVAAPDELARGAYESLVGDNSIQAHHDNALYILSCLALFEIEADPQFLSQRVRESCTELVDLGIIRRHPPFLYLGHRSLAGLIVAFLSRLQHSEPGRPAPAQVAVEYLRSAGSLQIKQTLDRLDLVSLSNNEDQFGAGFLAHCWTGSGVLVRRLSQQVAADPSWGDNVASAVFAAEAFAALGLTDDWRKTGKYIRARWSVPAGSNLPTTVDETRETDDFKAILEAMLEEDRLEPPQVRAKDIDVDQFHRTWVLGLLLGFEGTAIDRDPARRQELLRMARDEQLPNGAFYPERVPWVTARVVLGLAALGETSEKSSVAAAACKWLRTRRPEGPYSFGVWRPGTGRWNTDLQSTAVALLALGRSGVPPSDRTLAGGMSYLKDGRSEWYRPGKELDCAQAVEASLVLGATWRDFGTEIRSLLEWARNLEPWSSINKTASEMQDESSKTSAVASALIGIIWETLRSELALLFQGVIDLSVSYSAQKKEMPDWVEGGRELVRRLVLLSQENVRDRETAIARRRVGREIAEQLDLWRRRLVAVEALAKRLGAASAGEDWPDLLRGLNELGSEILGQAWVKQA